MAAVKDMELHHVDVKTAYLNGKLEEEIYMEKPKILRKGYWRLLKGLYGLKQAGRQWYTKINEVYRAIDMRCCESDWSTYTRSNKEGTTHLGMSVDDLLYASSSVEEADCMCNQIGSHFELTDMGNAEWILGCRITRWSHLNWIRNSTSPKFLRNMDDWA
jgi:hypothetical protein